MTFYNLEKKILSFDWIVPNAFIYLGKIYVFIILWLPIQWCHICLHQFTFTQVLEIFFKASYFFRLEIFQYVVHVVDIVDEISFIYYTF